MNNSQVVIIAHTVKTNKFGSYYYYPKNDNAVKFAELLCKKTLSYADAKIISELGFAVQIVSGETEYL